MSSVADRLSEAVEEWPGPPGGRGSKRQFALELGVARGTLYSYMSGDVEPSAAFLADAANILGVRAAWLAFGEEPRSDADEAVDQLEGAGRDRELWEAAARVAGVANYAGTDRARSLFLSLLRRTLRVRGAHGDVSPEDAEKVASDLMRGVWSALDAVWTGTGLEQREVLLSPGADRARETILLGLSFVLDGVGLAAEDEAEDGA